MADEQQQPRLKQLHWGFGPCEGEVYWQACEGSLSVWGDTPDEALGRLEEAKRKAALGKDTTMTRCDRCGTELDIPEPVDKRLASLEEFQEAQRVANQRNLDVVETTGKAIKGLVEEMRKMQAILKLMGGMTDGKQAGS